MIITAAAAASATATSTIRPYQSGLATVSAGSSSSSGSCSSIGSSSRYSSSALFQPGNIGVLVACYHGVAARGMATSSTQRELVPAVHYYHSKHWFRVRSSRWRLGLSRLQMLWGMARGTWGQDGAGVWWVPGERGWVRVAREPRISCRR